VVRVGAAAHNDSPVNGLDSQISDASVGSPHDQTLQAIGLFRQSETQSGMSEQAAEPPHQPIRR